MSTIILDKICIKSLNLSKSAESVISVNIVTLPDEVAVDYNAEYVFFSYKLELKSAKKSATTLSLSLVTRDSDGNSLKAKRSAIFKTIPREIYTMYLSAMVPKAIMPPLFEPDIAINILICDDPYGIEGWRVRDIFSALGITVHIPAVLNYRVFELSIKEGTPMLSMLQSLFPFPGITINYFNGAYYINISNEIVDVDVFYTCEQLTKNVDTKYYNTTVTGLNSEPLNIDNSVGPKGSMVIDLIGNSEGLSLQTNLIGGIYGTIYEYQRDVKQSVYVARMFDTYT